MAIPDHLNSRWLNSDGWIDDRPSVTLTVDVDEGLTRHRAHDVDEICAHLNSWANAHLIGISILGGAF